LKLFNVKSDIKYTDFITRHCLPVFRGLIDEQESEYAKTGDERSGEERGRSRHSDYEKHSGYAVTEKTPHNLNNFIQKTNLTGGMYADISIRMQKQEMQACYREISPDGQYPQTVQM
jgi:hypothetical protein